MYIAIPGNARLFRRCTTLACRKSPTIHMRFDVPYQTAIGAAALGRKSGQGAAATRDPAGPRGIVAYVPRGMTWWAPAGPGFPFPGQIAASSFPRLALGLGHPISCLLSTFLLWQHTSSAQETSSRSSRSSSTVASCIQHALSQGAIRHNGRVLCAACTLMGPHTHGSRTGLMVSMTGGKGPAGMRAALT